MKELEPEASEVVLAVLPEDIDSGIARVTGKGSLKLVIYNNKTDLAFNAKVSVRVIVECSRCLKEFELPIESESDFAARLGSPKQGEEENENILRFVQTDEELDISGIIAEEIGVNIPMKSVCAETCLGFCPGCGTNLNEKGCSCKQETVNPTWEALRKLKME